MCVIQSAWTEALSFLVVMGNLKIKENSSHPDEVLVEWQMRTAEEIGYFMAQIKVRLYYCAAQCMSG